MTMPCYAKSGQRHLFHPVRRLQTKPFTSSVYLHRKDDAFLLVPARQLDLIVRYDRGDLFTSTYMRDYIHDMVSRSAQVRIRILEEARENINRYILKMGVPYHPGEESVEQA